MPLPSSLAEQCCHGIAVKKQLVFQTPTQRHIVSCQTLNPLSLSHQVAAFPAGYFSLLNCSLSAVIHLEPEGISIEPSVVRCICLTFNGLSKGYTSPKFRGICRMCPVVRGGRRTQILYLSKSTRV